MAEWTQDEAIAYEVAVEDIGHVIATLTEDIYAEKDKEKPNMALIEKLEKEQKRLGDERRNLRVKDQENIARVREKYGAIIRARNAEYDKTRLAA